MSDNLEVMPGNGAAGFEFERAQIDIQIATAKKYPRAISKVKSDMLTLATLDEETAEGCFYTLPRGGKSIQGPSVRLAEIAMACWGNLRAGSRILSTTYDGPAPHVVIQGVAHDLEKNTAFSVEKRRRIVKKKSKDRLDEDDINLATNACAAIAFRDAVFKIVPLALVKPVMEAAKKVAVGDLKSLTAKRAKVIERLKKMGATEDRILSVVNVAKVEDIDSDKLSELIGLGTALKEGETTLEEAFPAIQSKPTFSKPKETDDITMTSSKPVPPESVPGVKVTDTPETTTVEATDNSGPQLTDPQRRLYEFLDGTSGTWDDFTDWMLNSGRAPGAKDWASIYEVPDHVCASLFVDTKNGLNKFRTLYQPKG